MEANIPSRAEVTAVNPATDTHGFPGHFKIIPKEPTFAEVAGLTFEPLRGIRIFHQEQRNNFANLLNRGSSLE